MTTQPAAPTTAVPALPRMFLRAGWYHLTMLNFLVEPAILQRHVPAGTELDQYGGRAYASVVGFLMLDTRVLGVPVPFHRNFEEVNLRFYVRRKDGTDWRRGVVFIKEMVPRRLIAWVARRLYNENYVAMPMRHHVALPGPSSASGTVRYEWYPCAGRRQDREMDPGLRRHARWGAAHRVAHTGGHGAGLGDARSDSWRIHNG